MRIWCAPTWRFLTELCKFLRNISTNIYGFGKRTDLKLGEVPFLFISNKITISWLYPLNGFRLIFFIAWQWKRSIVPFCCILLKIAFKNPLFCSALLHSHCCEQVLSLLSFLEFSLTWHHGGQVGERAAILFSKRILRELNSIFMQIIFWTLVSAQMVNYLKGEMFYCILLVFTSLHFVPFYSILLISFYKALSLLDSKEFLYITSRQSD